MRYLLCLLFTATLFAGSTLEFKNPFYACENRWVALSQCDDGGYYRLAFIYLDRDAGFTAHLDGEVKINKKGKLELKPKEIPASIKMRLQGYRSGVALISIDQVKTLGLPAFPEWLKIYRKGENQPAALVKRGYHYNHVGASNLAIKDLEKAYGINSKLKGVIFELSYAYNATNQFKKSLKLLKKELKKTPKDGMLLRELGFTYLRMGKFKEMERTYTLGIKYVASDFQKSEMAYNMAYHYYNQKNYKKFKHWGAMVKRYGPKGSRYPQIIEALNQKINRKK